MTIIMNPWQVGGTAVGGVTGGLVPAFTQQYQNRFETAVSTFKKAEKIVRDTSEEAADMINSQYQVLSRKLESITEADGVFHKLYEIFSPEWGVKVADQMSAYKVQASTGIETLTGFDLTAIPLNIEGLKWAGVGAGLGLAAGVVIRVYRGVKKFNRNRAAKKSERSKK